MAEDSVSDIVNSIKSEFPIFKDIQVRDRRDEGMSDNRQLEYYSEEDSPIEGVELVDIFNPKLQGEELKNAILGDMLHSAPSKSKKYADKKLQLINSRTPEQIEIDNRAYEIAIKQGEKRPFDKWYDVSRLDAFIRGYLVKQWDESYYTEEQKELMDSMLQTLKPKSGMSEGGSTSDQTEKAFRSNPLEGKQTVKRLKNVVRNAPVTGTLIDIADIGKSLLTGNYSQAAIDAGLALAGVTPVGKIASKGIQKTLKLFSKNKEDDPMGLVSDQIEKAPFTRAYGYTGRDSFVKTVLVPIEEAKKLFPNRRRFEAKDGSSSLGIDRIESLKSAIQSGKKLAPPFLTVNVPKKGSALLNSGHDGSHRISALEDLGHKYVPIDILSNVKLRGEEGEKIYKKILEGDRLAGQQGYMYTKTTGQEFNKGGTAMKKQMEMAFMEEGGLKDDGMDKDPVSGNDIPPGSLAKEVRDDIPAQLSEGEYVVPADVVQYYGVKFFEDLRTEAKRGLAEMDRDGRIGGEPVAVTMIATSGKEALNPKEEEQLREFMNASQGGLTGYAPGGAVTSSGQQLNQSSFNPANWAVVGGMPRGGGFQNQPAAVTYVTYVHKTDTTKPSIQVPIVNGQVQQGFVVPPDYIPQSQYSPPKPKSGGGKKGGGQGTMNKPDNDPWGTTEEYNWNDWKEEDFLKEAEKQLGKSGGEKLGQVAAGLVAGPVGYIAAGTYNNVDGIARTRAMALVAKARGLDEVASKLTTEADEAVEKSGWLTKFIDKMGWMDGQNKFNTISKKYDNFTTASTPVTDPISTSAVSKTDQSLTKNLATNKKKKDDIRAGFMSSPSIIQSTNEIIKKSKNPEDTQKNLDELTQKIASGSSVGFKEGGLLTKPKPKRKSRKPSGKGLGNK